MLENIVDVSYLKQESPPRFEGGPFWTFQEVDNFFGARNQSWINMRTSILRDTRGFMIYINEFIEKHFDNSNYILSYFDNEEKEGQYKMFSYNLMNFKQNKVLRNIMLDKIINYETLEFKKNLYPGYLFIVLSLEFIKKYNYFKSRQQAHQLTKTLISKYYDNEERLLNEVFKQIRDVDVIKYLTDVCYGRYYYLDLHLSSHEDLKGFPIEICKSMLSRRFRNE